MKQSFSKYNHEETIKFIKDLCIHKMIHNDYHNLHLLLYELSESIFGKMLIIYLCKKIQKCS